MVFLVRVCCVCSFHVEFRSEASDGAGGAPPQAAAAGTSGCEYGVMFFF